MKKYKQTSTNKARSMIRGHIRTDPYLPDALKFLRSTEMKAVSKAIGGVEPHSLVDLRYHLASAFVQHVRDIIGDRIKPNRADRRKALKSLLAKAEALRVETELNLQWLRDEHYEAKFFGASGPESSPFEYDYTSLLDPIVRLEAIAESILSAPPIGKGKTTSPFVDGFPSDRLENPGTRARYAFARRIGKIYFDLTGKTPGMTKEQLGPYQRMMVVVSDAFLHAYKAADKPFGEWRSPCRDDMQKACKSIGRKST